MYDYTTEKQKLFTDEGQRLFMAVRDRVLALLKASGAVRMGEAASLPSGIGAADSWTLMACIDRMAELEELREVGAHPDRHGQDRVFVGRGR